MQVGDNKPALHRRQKHSKCFFSPRARYKSGVLLTVPFQEATTRLKSFLSLSHLAVDFRARQLSVVGVDVISSHGRFHLDQGVGGNLVPQPSATAVDHDTHLGRRRRHSKRTPDTCQNFEAANSHTHPEVSCVVESGSPVLPKKKKTPAVS